VSLTEVGEETVLRGQRQRMVALSVNRKPSIAILQQKSRLLVFIRDAEAVILHQLLDQLHKFLLHMRHGSLRARTTVQSAISTILGSIYPLCDVHEQRTALGIAVLDICAAL
jgi:hypothetical protein